MSLLVSLLVICGAGGLACARGAHPESAYAAWVNGPSTDPAFFPLAVWLQDPEQAEAYRALGINTYVGLWQGPQEQQLARLRQAGIRVVCDQNQVGLKHRGDPIILAWMHGDEPDNAQPRPEGGYGPAIPTASIIADYHRMRAADPTRPVLLNLGQGVANDEWVGIGCDRSDYPQYTEGCDIVSFDVYPVVGIGKSDGENYLWYIARGLDRLREWSGGRKIIWNVIECTHIDNPDKKATPHQVRAEVWMSLIHGSLGIIYFVHQFQPTFIEAGLLADAQMTAAVKAINLQILSLAPVLNSPTICDGAAVKSSNQAVPIDFLVKKQGESTYLFAVGMRNQATHGSFRLSGLPPSATAEVLGESRNLPVRDGHFEDEFEPYDVHLYRVRPL
jgi:hypothetical protein